MKKEFNLLDCTLRDGGYYNNWKFKPEMVENYIRAMEVCEMDYVELGFRFNSSDPSIGPFGRTKDDFLDTLDLPISINYAVMINGKEFLLPNERETKKLVHKTFVPSEESVISLVRIAINFNNVLESKHIIKCIKELGYDVGLNLMQSGSKSKKEYVDTAKLISKWNLVDILYFADSFGSMDNDEISSIVRSLKKGWNGALGFHSHNNKGFALGNTLKAIDEGITFCDCTVTGMGRGAGNVSTESLLMELQNRDLIDIDLSLLQATVSDFSSLQKKYRWGSNILYQYAANNNIHPTFVQTLTEDNRYDEYQKFKILEALGMEDSSSFSRERLSSIIYKNNIKTQGSWDPKGYFENQEILLVGGGLSVKKYKNKILKLIKQKNLKVVFTNLNKYLPQELGNATIVSHEVRAFLDATFYNKLSHPLIIPLQTLGKLINKYLSDIELLDYGLNIKEGAMKIEEKSCTLNSSVVAGYALSICHRAGANKINLVGFDGYHTDDARFQEMESILDKFKNLDSSPQLVSLTPTNYDLDIQPLD